jgi:hypothetical protein
MIAYAYHDMKSYVLYHCLNLIMSHVKSTASRLGYDVLIVIQH